MKRDIHKIDNYLIRCGWLSLTAALLSSGCTPDGATALGYGWFTWAAFGAGLPLLLAGYTIRRKERRVLAVWNILDQVTEAPVEELIRNTGLSRQFIQESLGIINAQPNAYYVWNPDTDVVVDGRLRTRVFVVDHCANCGASVSLRLTLELSELPTCSHCASPVMDEDWNRLKLDALREIREAGTKGSEFSVGLFIVLLIVFWPAALGYALWKSGLIDGWLARAKAV